MRAAWLRASKDGVAVSDEKAALEAVAMAEKAALEAVAMAEKAALEAVAMAEKAAPYVHTRLASERHEHTGNDGGPMQVEDARHRIIANISGIAERLRGGASGETTEN